MNAPHRSNASGPPGWARLLLSEHAVLALATAAALLFWAAVPGFATPANAANIGSNLLPLLALAIGQTIVLIGGGIDLSVTSTIALASVAGAAVMTGDGGPLAGSPLAVPAAVAAMLGVGLAVGLVNGIAVVRLGMPAFMVTLAAMMMAGGLAVRATRSQKIYGLPDAFLALADGRWLGVPIGVWVVGPLALGAHVVLSRTVAGRWLYAVGRNRRAAWISGVPVGLVVAGSYLAVGGCNAVGSMVYTARLMTGSPEIAPRILLDVIAACVIGGTSLFGGRGTVAGTMYGVLFIAVIDNGLNLMNLSNFMIMVVKGGVILLAALLDAERARLAGRG